MLMPWAIPREPVASLNCQRSVQIHGIICREDWRLGTQASHVHCTIHLRVHSDVLSLTLKQQHGDL